MPIIGVFAISFRCPGKASGWVKVLCLSLSVPNPHQVSKMSSLWRIESK